MVYMKVYDINGKEYDTQHKNNVTWTATDLTSNTIHRMMIRGGKQVVFIQGDKIASMLTYAEDNK